MSTAPIAASRKNRMSPVHFRGQELQVPDQQHRSDAQESGAASTLRSRQPVTDEAQ